MQAAQAQTVHAGCMVYKNGYFLVQDRDARSDRGHWDGFGSNVGNRVEVRGAVSSAQTDVAPATSVMNVASVAVTAQGGCLSVADAERYD